MKLEHYRNFRKKQNRCKLYFYSVKFRNYRLKVLRLVSISEICYSFTWYLENLNTVLKLPSEKDKEKLFREYLNSYDHRSTKQREFWEVSQVDQRSLKLNYTCSDLCFCTLKIKWTFVILLAAQHVNPFLCLGNSWPYKSRWDAETVSQYKNGKF